MNLRYNEFIVSFVNAGKRCRCLGKENQPKGTLNIGQKVQQWDLEQEFDCIQTLDVFLHTHLWLLVNHIVESLPPPPQTAPQNWFCE